MNQIGIEPIEQFLNSHHRSCQQQERRLHIHNNAYEIMLFVSGNVDYFINNVTYHLKPGDLTFVGPDDIHGYFVKDDSPYERLPVHIEIDYAAALSTEATDLLSCFASPSARRLCHLDKEQIHQFIGFVDAVIQAMNRGSFGQDIIVHSCISMLLLMANEAQRADESAVSDVSPRIIRDAIDYISANLAGDISVQTIADCLNISRSRLCHQFKDFTGISLWNYVISRRIQRAQSLLREGVSITETCYECGFKDYAHFVKAFSKVIGVPPGKYTKELPTYQMSGRPG